MAPARTVMPGLTAIAAAVGIKGTDACFGAATFSFVVSANVMAIEVAVALLRPQATRTPSYGHAAA